MKRHVVLALILLRTAGVPAQGAPPLTVAVYDFTDADRRTGSYGSKVTTLVTADLTTETNLIMVERSELKKALGEQALDISGMVSSDTAAKIGAITGAKVLVCGQVIMTEPDHLVIVANIIGTETGRLFAAKVDGPAGKLLELTTSLSRKIAQKINEQSPHFVAENKSHDEYLERIVKSVTGTNRPTVSVNIHWPHEPRNPGVAANTEMGIILQKAGFVVVDGQSERKPDVEITGQVETDGGPRHGHLCSSHAVIDAKVQERMTGKIMAFDHQTADAVDIGQNAARKAAEVKAVDGLAERIVPLLAR